MLDTAQPEGGCGLRNGQAPKRGSEALLPEGTWDVSSVRWWVDPGVEQEHTCPNTACEQGSPSLWTDITPLRPESSNSGLGEGDSKRRRVSPYPSSGDSSSPAGAPSPFDKDTEAQFYNYFPN